MSDNIFVTKKGFLDVRRCLRLIYSADCFDSEACCKRLKIKRNTWEKLLKRVKLYLPEGFLLQEQKGHRRILKCVYDRTKKSGNSLCEIFRNRAFTPADIFLFMNILILTEQQPKGCMRLISEINEKVDSEEEQIKGISESAVLKCINNMIEEGYLEEEKEQKKQKRYKLSEDIWKDFSQTELEELYEYICFVKNVVHFETPFYLLEKKLELYIESKGNIRNNNGIKQDNVIFTYNNNLACCLDNEILLEFLKIIKKKKMAIIQEDIDEKLGIPIKVISDALSGEQYVLFYYVEKDTVEEILLSNISEVTECETYSDTFDVKIGQILSNCKENWNSRYCEGEFTKVCIQFQNSDKIRRRVEREGRGGKISDISSEWFYYEKEVRNPLDMLPWIRTFGCGAIVVESGKAELEEILYQEWKEVCVLNEFIDEECE